MPWPIRPPRLSLALQGGGAHGAFTWGVLDALLEHGCAFDGVSGTSAGAMNAVVLAHGLAEGGPTAARHALRAFWMAVADSLPFEVAQSSADGRRYVLVPAWRMLLQWSQHFTPEQINPLDLNPLRDILHTQVDFARLRRSAPVRLFIAATHVNTGKLRLFRTAELSADAVLASACLPMLHRTVVIDGEPYWDGGYAANPAVYPLLHDCSAADILLVLLAPLQHPETPQTAQAIRQRALELAFHANFLREMRMYAQWHRHIQATAWWRRGPLERRLARTRFHLIEASDFLGEQPAESRLAVHRRFFEQLHQLGRERALAWLQAHRSAIGRHSSVDWEALFE
jgi:NTE family protein